MKEQINKILAKITVISFVVIPAVASWYFLGTELTVVVLLALIFWKR